MILSDPFEFYSDEVHKHALSDEILTAAIPVIAAFDPRVRTGSYLLKLSLTEIIIPKEELNAHDSSSARYLIDSFCCF